MKTRATSLVLALAIVVGGCGDRESSNADTSSKTEESDAASPLVSLLLAQVPAVEYRGFEACHLAASMLDAVLPAYETLIEKEVVVDRRITEAVTMTIYTDQFMTREEAIRLYEDTFLINGYGVQIVDEQTVKVVDISNRPDYALEGVPFYRQGEDFPETDDFIAYIMKLDNLSADECGRIFQLYTGPLSSRYNSSPDGSTLIFSAPGSTVRALIELKKVIDVLPQLVSYPKEFMGFRYSENHAEEQTGLDQSAAAPQLNAE